MGLPHKVLSMYDALRELEYNEWLADHAHHRRLKEAIFASEKEYNGFLARYAISKPPPVFKPAKH